MITSAMSPVLFILHQVPSVVVVVEEAILAGAGYPVYEVPGKKKKRVKRHNIDEVLELAMRELYELATDEDVPLETQEAVAKLVKPFAESKARIPEASTVDWVALERSAATVEKLLALWQAEIDQDNEDEEIILKAYRHFYQ